MSTLAEHRITAAIDYAGFGLIRFPVKTAEITLDESWSPYLQARLTSPWVLGSTNLDPRQNISIVVTVQRILGRIDRVSDLSRRWRGATVAAISDDAGSNPISALSATMWHDYQTPGHSYREPVTRTFAGMLRSRVIRHAAGEVELTMASWEARLFDDAHIAVTPLVPDTVVSVAGLTNYVLARVGLDKMKPENFDPAAANSPIDPETRPWAPGMSNWDYISGHVGQYGFRLWCDERGEFRLNAVQPSGLPINLADRGPTRSITEASDTISRDADWYTAVVLTYRWTTDDGESHEAYDAANSGAADVAPARVYTETLEKRFPGVGLADRMLNRFKKMGRVVAIEAVSDYDVSPGSPIIETIPNTPALRGTVSAVTWRFPDDRMNVTTRDLQEVA